MATPNPTTELLEAISRWPARDAYEMQVKQMAQQWAREVVAENERLQNLADRTLTLLTLLETGPWKDDTPDADWRKLLADLRGG